VNQQTATTGFANEGEKVIAIPQYGNCERSCYFAASSHLHWIDFPSRFTA